MRNVHIVWPTNHPDHILLQMWWLSIFVCLKRQSHFEWLHEIFALNIYIYELATSLVEPFFSCFYVCKCILCFDETPSSYGPFHSFSRPFSTVPRACSSFDPGYISRSPPTPMSRLCLPPCKIITQLKVSYISWDFSVLCKRLQIK